MIICDYCFGKCFSRRLHEKQIDFGALELYIFRLRYLMSGEYYIPYYFSKQGRLDVYESS